MCGIAGILNCKSDSNKLDLKKMLDRLSHRGPDDWGLEGFEVDSDRELVLGHRRLSIIDLSSGGHQPMTNEDRSIWVTTNSEIYNYKSLRKNLETDFNFRTQSDTEVLLRAYEKWGVDCLERFDGMFAFAIWDARSHKLFLARDRLGIKPLYYRRTAKKLEFASEVRALISSHPELNSDSLYEYLLFGRVGSDQSLIKGVRGLKAGHFLCVSPDKIGDAIEKPYWRLIRKREQLRDPADIKIKIKENLEAATDKRLNSDVPLATFLSGGVDSSVIVSLVAKNNLKKANTLSVVFDEKRYDESVYSEKISNLYKTNHHPVLVTEKAFQDMMPQSIDSLDSPSIDGVNTWVLSRVTRERGFKVALMGLGADELFGGYPSFRYASGVKFLNATFNVLPSSMKPIVSSLFKTFSPLDITGKLSLFLKGPCFHPWLPFRSLFSYDEINFLFQDKELACHGLSEQLSKTQETLLKLKGHSLFDQVSYLELMEYTQPTLLRDTDQMSMAHGLEIRVPFLDYNFVDLLFSVPAAVKSGNGQAKGLMLDSLPNSLPRNTIKRKKMGFTFPFEKWMRGGLKKECEEVLMSPTPPLSPFLSDESIMRVWQKFLKGKISWSRPWSLYVLKKWIAKNFSGV